MIVNIPLLFMDNDISLVNHAKEALASMLDNFKHLTQLYNSFTKIYFCMIKMISAMPMIKMIQGSVTRLNLC